MFWFWCLFSLVLCFLKFFFHPNAIALKSPQAFNVEDLKPENLLLNEKGHLKAAWQEEAPGDERGLCSLKARSITWNPNHLPVQPSKKLLAEKAKLFFSEKKRHHWHHPKKQSSSQLSLVFTCPRKQTNKTQTPLGNYPSTPHRQNQRTLLIGHPKRYATTPYRHLAPPSCLPIAPWQRQLLVQGTNWRTGFNSYLAHWSHLPRSPFFVREDEGHRHGSGEVCHREDLHHLWDPGLLCTGSHSIHRSGWVDGLGEFSGWVRVRWPSGGRKRLFVWFFWWKRWMFWLWVHVLKWFAWSARVARSWLWFWSFRWNGFFGWSWKVLGEVSCWYDFGCFFWAWFLNTLSISIHAGALGSVEAMQLALGFGVSLPTQNSSVNEYSTSIP